MPDIPDGRSCGTAFFSRTRFQSAPMTSLLQRYRSRRFLVLLIALVLLLVIQPMAYGYSARSPVFFALSTLALVAAILALCQERWPTRLALVFGIPALLGRSVAYLLSENGDARSVLTDHCVEIFFLGFVAVMILRSILSQDHVTMDSIFGAICAYLLLGIVWGAAYSVLEVSQPGSFDTTPAMAEALKSPKTRGPALIYYSFVTMATVGYGDITPLSASARTLSWLQAMTGQFYIAVLVAFLVGIHVARRPAPEP